MAVRDLGIVTAYGYAVEGGYTGTEQEFTALLGDLALTVEDLENMTVSVTTLEPNQQATASYVDGVLSLGIPKGVAGEVQFSDLEPLAEKDGNYENFTAGSALQLISDKYTENKEPYLFRKSIAGDRELDTLVGGSVAWNQQIRSGDFSQGTDGWTAYNATLSASDGGVKVVATSAWGTLSTAYYYPTYISGHKYLTIVLAKGESGGEYFALNNSAGVNAQIGTLTTTKAWYSKISESNYTGEARFALFTNNSGVTFYVYKAMVFDLTQMFGTAVADRLYQMEQANAGSGVAWFKERFPKEYYAYNAGEIMSVKTSAHEMVGKNQLDPAYRYETSASGNYHVRFYWAGGTETYHNELLLKSGVQYTFSFRNATNASVIYIKSDASTNVFTKYNATSITFTPTRDMYFACDIYWATEVDVSAVTCQLEFGDTATEYEPYQKHTYPLDPIELRGIPKVASDGSIYWDGDRYSADGNVDRRYGIVDLGTLTWRYDGTTVLFYATIEDAVKNKNTGLHCVCSIYRAVEGYSPTGGINDTTQNNVVSVGSSYLSADLNLLIRNTTYTDATAFKTAMSGVYLVYEIATPTTETADPYTSPQIVDAYGTERYVDEREVAVPVGHETKYPDNLREKLDGLPWDFSNLIAPTEKAYKATRNYTVGSYLIMDNTLYKVTAAIASGGTITVGTNVAATTIMAEIIAAL